MACFNGCKTNRVLTALEEMTGDGAPVTYCFSFEEEFVPTDVELRSDFRPTHIQIDNRGALRANSNLRRLASLQRGLSMNDQDLKNKYQPVADFMSRNGFQIEHFHAKDGKAVLTAKAPTEFLKNRVWDEIKKVDPSFADLQHDITVGTETAYVVKSGDNLSNISKSFYGDANKYSRILKANKLEDPDKIKAGQTLIIPAA